MSTRENREQKAAEIIGAQIERNAMVHSLRVKGYSNAAIANTLGISANIVRSILNEVPTQGK